MKLLIVMAIMLFVGCGNPVKNVEDNVIMSELVGKWGSYDMIFTFTEKEFEWLISDNCFSSGTWIPKKDSVIMNWINNPPSTHDYKIYNDTLNFLNSVWIRHEQQY